jgi:hypothetical protein
MTSSIDSILVISCSDRSNTLIFINSLVNVLLEFLKAFSEIAFLALFVEGE